MKFIETADGSRTLHSERYRETYHSVNGATTESRHVYLSASGVARRLERHQPTRVLEIGFGLGLNCLLTFDQALHCGTVLDYHAVEHDLPSADAFKAMHYHRHLLNSDLESWLLQEIQHVHRSATLANEATDTGQQCAFPPLDTAGSAPANELYWRGMTLQPFNDGITLTLYLGDTTRLPLPIGPFDAIYLDAFSPNVNPECWTTEMFQRLHAGLGAGGVLTTYCSRGSVRRGLASAGFSVNKLAGPPGKREILQAFA